MIRRHNNKGTYKIETKKAVYLVTLSRLNNGAYGQPRYDADIIVLLAKEDKEKLNNKEYFYTANYTFGGHYCGDQGEAEYIVNYFEENH